MATFEIGRDGPGVLVVGLDGSSTAADALAYAVGMARRGGSELVIVQVGPSVPAAVAAASVGGVPYAPDDDVVVPLDPAVVSALDELVGGRWRMVTGAGDPASELERVAGSYRADAIVVGRSRNPGRHLLGSVAARLVRHADHPVIVVP